MRNRKKIAGFALGITVISGILGIVGLAILGVETASGTAYMLTESVNLTAAFYVLLAVMAVSTVVMVLAIPKKK